MSTNFINKNITMDIANEELNIDRDEQIKVNLEVNDMLMTGLKIANKIKTIKFMTDILILISAIYTSFLLYFGFISITLYNNELIPTYGIAGLVLIFAICGILQLAIYLLKIPLSDIIDCIESRSEYNIYYKFAILNNLMAVGIIKNILERNIFENSCNSQDY